MLLEIAIGDAYGAGFEFVSPEIIQAEHQLNQYYPSRIDMLEAGQYTDDTQMSIAIVELMLSGAPWTKESITKYFLKAFHRDPRHGYAKRFYTFLTQQQTAQEFLANIHPHSKRNGAAMRAVPIGLYPTIQEVMDKAALQASITHDTPEGIVSAQAVALMAHYHCYQLGSPQQLQAFVEHHCQWQFDHNKQTPVACDALETIDGVLTVLKNGKTLREVLDLAVKLGGDTDSVASIACGVASFSADYPNDWPAFLYTELEQEEYGKAYIEALDKQVLGMFLG
ncbi:MAG: ADP-ribosylglycohydrolase family protein [Aureispira sp.]